MKVINPLYRTPATSDTEAYGCRCRCSTGSANQFERGEAHNPGCGCQCSYGELNKDTNFEYAKSRAF